MNLIKLIFFFIITANASEAFESVHSPHNKFRCDFVAKQESGIIVTLTDTTTGKTLQVMDCDRWAEIHWSPNDKKFAIENHWDGQASYLQIFEIVSSENRIGLVEIYHSPWLAQLLGVEWKLKSWSIKKGRATIIRKAVTKLTGAKYKDQEEFQVLLD